MSSLTRLSRRGRLLAVATAVAALSAGGGMAWATPGLPSGDGLEIPGLKNGPDGCSVTSSDPKNRNSCNAEGGNGSDGKPGAVHRNGHTYYGGEDGEDGEDNTSR